MKKALCILLALLLCLGNAWAESGENRQIEWSMGLSEKSIANLLEEDQQDLAAAVKQVLEHLSLRFFGNDQTARMEVCLKDQCLLDATWEQDGEHVYMTTSLLPGYVLAEPQVPDVEKDDLGPQLADVLKKYTGEMEKGFFPVKEVSSVVFNNRLSVELDEVQLGQMLADMLHVLMNQLPEAEVDILTGYELYSMEEAVRTAFCGSGVYLKGDYYTRKNGDILCLFRLFLGDEALDFFWGTEGDYATIVLVPCDAPHATRIALNIQSALKEDMLDGVIISTYEYEQGKEWMLVSPYVMGYFSREILQGKEYGTLDLELDEEWGLLGVGMAYEKSEDTVEMNLKVLTEDYQSPDLTLHLEGTVCEEGPAPLDKTGKTLVYTDKMDDAVWMEMEQAMAMPLAQLVIDGCTAMPDEMALITNAAMKWMGELEDWFGIIGGADGPTSIYLGDDEDGMLEAYQIMIDELGWDMQAEDLTEEERQEVEEAYMEMILTEYGIKDKDVEREENEAEEQLKEDAAPKPTARPLFGPK